MSKCKRLLFCHIDISHHFISLIYIFTFSNLELKKKTVAASLFLRVDSPPAERCAERATAASELIRLRCKVRVLAPPG